jgi:glycosyltransferase XagB
MIVISMVLAAFAAVTLWWTMHAWRTPETLAATRFAEPDGDHRITFSLLVPARHEQAVLEHTVERLLRSTHQGYEIIIIVGHDDPETAAVADRVAATAPGRILVVTDHNEVKNKPRALNTALPYVRGDVVGVFDAEDQVHPQLLEHVDHAFRSTDADVVQGGVQLINFHSSWYSLHNCLEYFFWFRSRLHLHAKKGFIPLGGNTVFVRTDVLRAANGWDGTCLAEDCDLGVRLSSRGAKVVVAYESSLVTREETPGTLAGLLKQRTRWNQGFLQVLRKGEWRRLPHLQAAAARPVHADRAVPAGLLRCGDPDRRGHRGVGEPAGRRRAGHLRPGRADVGQHRVPDRRAARLRQALSGPDPMASLRAADPQRLPVRTGAQHRRAAGRLARVHRQAQLGADRARRRAPAG